MINWTGRILATGTALILWGPMGAAFSVGIVLAGWPRRPDHMPATIRWTR